MTGPILARRPLLAAAPLLGLAGCTATGGAALNFLAARNGVTRTRDIAYGPDPRQKLDVYRQDAAVGPLPVVVFVYGGNWRSGSKDLYPFVAEPLAHAGFVVVVPDYRLYPQVIWPGFLTDCAAATVWAMRNVPAYGGDPRSLVLLGHSAGAYNTAMLALDPRWLGAAGADPDALAGTVGLAGPYDFLPIRDPEVRQVFANHADDPLTQPINHVDGRNRPMLLLAGTADETVNPRNTTALAERIAAAGGPVTSRLYPGITHIGMITSFSRDLDVHAPTARDVEAFVLARRAPTEF